MNIFFLDRDAKRSAQAYCDKHMKIILEICQMLWTAWHVTQGVKDPQAIPVKVYKPTHINHPMSKWVRRHPNNYLYACRLGLELCAEKKKRYPQSPPHACEVILKWLSQNVPNLKERPSHHSPPPAKRRKITRVSSKSKVKPTRFAVTGNPPGVTPVPLCMPEEYHHSDLVTAYRQYYQGDKHTIATWKTSLPEWWSCSLTPCQNIVKNSTVFG